MTTLQLPAAAGALPALQAPSLRGILKHSGSSLIQATVGPTVLFYVGWFALGHLAAFVAAFAWALGVLTIRLHRRERVQGLLILSFAALTGRTIAAIATGSSYVYFLQPIIWTALVGVGFLVSCFTARPFVARLAADFYPVADDVLCRVGVRRLLRQLTVLWGVANLVNAGVMLWLLQTMSTTAYVGTKAITCAAITWGTIALTVVWSVSVAREEGLLPHAAAAPSSAS